ncbi:MAG: macro domain-containing protein [Candidatus Magasanikbacteria bacterium]
MSFQKQISDIIIKCVQGDITSQDVDVVVNAANAKLEPGGGVAGAVHREAGPKLYEECKEIGSIEVGKCVVTGGYDLPNDNVIHCLGPRYGADPQAKEHLARCYKEALRLADERKLKSIAFPAISTGAFGYPVEEAAKVSWEAVEEVLGDLESIEEIRFVLYDSSDLEVYKEEMKKVG